MVNLFFLTRPESGVKGHQLNGAHVGVTRGRAGARGPRSGRAGRRSARSPVSTPGVNDTRSSESWRIVSVSPDAAEHAPPGGRPGRGPAARARGCRRRRRRGRRRGRSTSRRAPAPSPASRRAAAISSRRTPRGAGGRVGLVGVVQLDHLDRLEERRGRGGEPHHQHRADGEVGGDQHAGLRGVGEPAARRSRAGPSSKPVVPTTAWMPWSMQNSRLSITTSGWVKSTTACGARPRPEPAGRRRRRPAATSSRSSACLHGRGTPRCRPCPAPRARRPVVPPSRRRTYSGGISLTSAATSGRLGAWRCSTIPPRIRWAVDLMDAQPSDHVLEIGCGPGAGGRADLRAARDRQAVRDRPLRVRCRPHQAALRASTSRPAGSPSARSTWPRCGCPVKRLNKVFAFNVNLFWVRECADEVALLHERVLPGGAVYLFYEANRPELVPTIVSKASAALTDGGLPGLRRRAEGARRSSGSSASAEACPETRRASDLQGGPRTSDSSGRRRCAS